MRRPARISSNLDYNGGVYVQDRWTLNRMTLSGALRYDVQHESYDAYTAGPTKYLPNRNVSFPAANVVSWKELNPRAGVSYDLFGNGKTAIKASMARGVAQESLATADALNPAVSLVDEHGADGHRQQQQPHPRLRPVQLAAQRRVRPVADEHVRQRRPGTQNDPARFPASACGRGTGSSRPAFSSS